MVRILTILLYLSSVSFWSFFLRGHGVCSLVNRETLFELRSELRLDALPAWDSSPQITARKLCILTTKPDRVLPLLYYILISLYLITTVDSGEVTTAPVSLVGNSLGQMGYRDGKFGDPGATLAYSLPMEDLQPSGLYWHTHCRWKIYSPQGYTGILTADGRFRALMAILAYSLPMEGLDPSGLYCHTHCRWKV